MSVHKIQGPFHKAYDDELGRPPGGLDGEGDGDVVDDDADYCDDDGDSDVNDDEDDDKMRSTHLDLGAGGLENLRQGGNSH